MLCDDDKKNFEVCYVYFIPSFYMVLKLSHVVSPMLDEIYTNLPKVFVQHKITLVVNVPLWTNIESGAMMGIKILKYRKHTVLGLTFVKI